MSAFPNGLSQASAPNVRLSPRVSRGRAADAAAVHWGGDPVTHRPGGGGTRAHRISLGLPLGPQVRALSSAGVLHVCGSRTVRVLHSAIGASPALSCNPPGEVKMEI